MTTGGPAARVRELMERIADVAGVEATVEVHQGPDGLNAEYVGDELEVLIGRHGETIDAIQHLAYRIARPGDGERVSVLVDAAGYREQRATTLRAVADQAVETAITDRRPVSLEPMNALERKVIHEYLKGRRDVETFSEGQEPSRRLVVTPLVD
jgi:spoIIIJ-associated protein